MVPAGALPRTDGCKFCHDPTERARPPSSDLDTILLVVAPQARPSVRRRLLEFAEPEALACFGLDQRGRHPRRNAGRALPFQWIGRLSDSQGETLQRALVAPVECSIDQLLNQSKLMPWAFGPDADANPSNRPISYWDRNDSWHAIASHGPDFDADAAGPHISGRRRQAGGSIEHTIDCGIGVHIHQSG